MYETNVSYTITDNGTQSGLVSNNEVVCKIPRYGVWVTQGINLVKCIDTGNNLANLKKKYKTKTVVRMY